MQALRRTSFLYVGGTCQHRHHRRRRGDAGVVVGRVATMVTHVSSLSAERNSATARVLQH